MAKEPFTQEAFLKRLEELGESEVRIMLSAGRFGEHYGKRSIAEEWLLRKTLAREDASSAEQARIARSANRAAWTAAITAIIAAIITVIGTVISVISNWSAISRMISFA